MLSKWSEWGPTLPWIITSVSVAYAAYVHYRLRLNRAKQDSHIAAINVDKHNKKHVFRVGHQLQKGQELAICRCWRSETFPLCDGTHKKYNKESGDCVGAAVVEWPDSRESLGIDIEDLENQKTLIDQMDIQSMSASTELSSMEMIDSNGENGSSRDSPHSIT